MSDFTFVPLDLDLVVCSHVRHVVLFVSLFVPPSRCHVYVHIVYCRRLVVVVVDVAVVVLTLTLKQRSP